MLQFVPTLLYGVLVLGVLVFVHELGHFLVAKWLGVRVLSFSIGMGPRLFGFRMGGTDYRISALPLGGFVRMAGDNPEEERTGDPGEFLEKPWWARALITVAGPVANLIFAVVLFFAVYALGYTESDYPARVGAVEPSSIAARVGLHPGDSFAAWAGASARTMGELDQAVGATMDARTGPDPVPFQVERGGRKVALKVPKSEVPALTSGLRWDTDTVIGKVLIGLPAYEAGIREGDQILSINGRPITNWTDLSSDMRAHPDQDVALEVRRGEQTFRARVHTTGEGYIGISPVEKISISRSHPPLEAARMALLQTVHMTGQIYAGLWSFVSDPVKLHGTVAGPIAIAQVANQQASGGLDRLVAFAAFISLALMAMNLLPIPILDGGHVFFALIEGIRRRPLSIKTQLFFQRIGLVVLVGLVIFSFYNDLNRVTRHNRAVDDISKRLTDPAPGDSAGRPGAP